MLVEDGKFSAGEAEIPLVLPCPSPALTVLVGSHQVVDLLVGAGGEDLNEALLIRADTLRAQTHSPVSSRES